MAVPSFINRQLSKNLSPAGIHLFPAATICHIRLHSEASIIRILFSPNTTTYGAEFGLGYILNENWKAESSLTYVHGENNTNNKPLPQLSPLEARLGLTYSNNKWTLGGLVRGVAAQTRFDINKGNIVGKDLGVSSGFAVFSLNSSYKFNADTLLSAGADNLFDRKYAEFISRSSGNGMGGSIPDYLQSMP